MSQFQTIMQKEVPEVGDWFAPNVRPDTLKVKYEIEIGNGSDYGPRYEVVTRDSMVVKVRKLSDGKP